MAANRFAIVTAADVIAGEADIPHAPGVYAALFPRGRQLLQEWGGSEFGMMNLGVLRGHPVFYVGSTVKLGLDIRIAHHAAATARQSTLRRSLGLLLAEELDLVPVATPGRHDFHFSDGEERLTQWMSENVLFAYRQNGAPRQTEQRLIDRLDPLMDILNRGHKPFARLLLDMRYEVWGPMIIEQV